MKKQFETKFKKYLSNDSGTINIMAALLIVPMIGVMSFAVELGIAHGTRIENQSAADLSALAAALNFAQTNDETQAQNVGLASLRASGYRSSSDTITISVITSPNNASSQAIQAEVTTEQPYFFARVIGAPNSQEITSSAIVELGGAGEDACIIALENSSSDSVIGRGGADLTAVGCGIGSNGDVNIGGGSDFQYG